MDKIQGKHFSITDPQGVNTVIYRVNKTPRELLQEYPKFTVQRLEYAEELNGNLFTDLALDGEEAEMYEKLYYGEEE